MSQVDDVSAVRRQPFQAGDNLRGETDAAFADGKSLMVDLADPRDDVEIAAGDRGVVDRTVFGDPFFEAAAPTTATKLFPFRAGELILHGDES